VLHLSGRVGLGRDVGDLLELQRALERDGQADVPSEVEEERCTVMPLGDLLDRMVAVEIRGDLPGQCVHLGDQAGDLGGGERVPDLGELQREEVEERDLRRESLRGGDGHLDPSPRVEDPFDLLGDLGAHHVRDRKRAGAGLPRQANCVDGVARLAGLGDAYDERVLRQHRIAVAPFARDVGLAGEPRPLLDHVAAHDARVVGGPGREHDHAPQVLDLEVREPEVFELEAPPADSVADRVRDRLGLLVDLLEHERLVAMLLGRLVVPVDLEFLPLARAVFDRIEAGAVLRDGDHLAVLDQLHPTGIAQERGDRRREEHLPLSDPDHERALETGPDQHVGMLAVSDHESEMAFEFGVRLGDGLNEVAGVVTFDQMNDDLGVRLRGEPVAVLLERILQLAEVLNDAVEDDRDLVFDATGQRVRVLV
jgi:hypothetical protein